MKLRRTALLALAAPLALLLGCTNPDGEGGGTDGVVMYAFDDTSKQVLVWKNLSTFNDAGTVPDPDLKLSHTLLNPNKSLAWGGMAVDADNGHLYLLYENGTLVRIDRLRQQTGSIIATDIVQATISDHKLSNQSTFGQLAVDAASHRIYFTETDTNATQVWVLDGADTFPNQATSLTTHQFQVAGDSGGTGVAVEVGGGTFYGAFDAGNPITNPANNEALTGPRVRQGSATTGFNTGAFQVLVGSNTHLSEGSTQTLALDRANNVLFVARKLGSTGAPVLGFLTSKFTPASGLNPTPDYQLGDSTTPGSLRVLSHPGNKDWLVGVPESGASLWLWKQPTQSGSTPKNKALSGVTIRGVALDGSAG